MPASKSLSAERMRRLRDRKRCGIVVLQDLEIQPSGVHALMAHGWLDAEDAHDAAEVRAALVRMVNDTLTERPGLPPFRQALKVMTLGLF